MVAVNFLHHHFLREQMFVAVADSDLMHSEFLSEKLDEPMPAVDYYSKVNFSHTSVPFSPIKNLRRINTGYHPPVVRIYTAGIQNSMRVTVKFFKVVIAPLWYMRGRKN